MSSNASALNGCQVCIQILQGLNINVKVWIEIFSDIVLSAQCDWLREGINQVIYQSNEWEQQLQQQQV